MPRWLRTAAVAAAVVIVVAILVLAALALAAPAIVTAARFSSLRTDYTALRDFLQRMPKGADLHVHLSGAVYAEDLIAWAAQKALCVSLSDLTISAGQPCDEADKRPPIANALKDQDLYDRIVNALSMRNFVPSAADPSGHDQFFDTFGRYGAITGRSAAEMTVERLRHYAADAVQYTELMVSVLGSDDRRRLAASLGDEQDFAKRLAILKGGELDAMVARGRDQVDAIAADVNRQLGCTVDRSPPGCAVGYRLIVQVSRTVDEREVFVQTAFAAALVKAQPLVAGLNFVGPEDYRVAREDYRAHMRMIGFLAADVPVALHAGELWLGLVPPRDLTFHIREAVEIAGARRIGHGVTLAFEGSDALLAEMRRKSIAVEVALTSNDVILGVRGKDHPLPAYWAAGVPVVLATDDAGVSRIDLTNEYVRAARDYGFGYRDLKAIARNSLVYSFLGALEKKAALDRFDRLADDFEHSVAAERSVFGNMAALINGPFRALTSSAAR